MKVNCYTLGGIRRDGGSTPRAWRISTDEGAFWLVEDGAASRLVQLPYLESVGDREAHHGAEPLDALTALACTAESEAAGRWVRRGPVRPVAHVAEEQP